MPELNSLTVRWRGTEMSPDEARIVHMFVAKLMGEGRVEYGPMDLAATGGRSSRVLLNEAIDEGIDSIAYMLMAKRKAELEEG